MWYARLIERLHWEAAAGHARSRMGSWHGGCFFKPQGRSCHNALVPRRPDEPLYVQSPLLLNTTALTIAVCRSSKGLANGSLTQEAFDCARLVGGRDMLSVSACLRMAEFYTPQLAARVTEYARDDLLLYGYPEWNGSVSRPWY
jgi:hypothetical protein